MATKVVVPRLGEGVDEVTVSKWLKKEGDTVNELEPLLEVNTDKVDTEVPSPTAGTVLKIVAQEGVPAKVGAVLAFIGKPGESLEGAATVAAPGGEGAPSPAEAKAPAPAAPAQAAKPQPEDGGRQPSVAASQPPAAGREIGFISP